MPSDRDGDRIIDLFGLALRLEGTIEQRVLTLLEYVRVNVLGDCEAILISQDEFDFKARHLRLGQIKGAVRFDIDASLYKLLRSPDFLEWIDRGFPAWADKIVGEKEKTSNFWMCETAAAAGVDVTQWRDDLLHPAGLEDVWGATAYVGGGLFLTVLLPLHRGGSPPTPEQVEFVRKLPRVLAPLLIPGTTPAQKGNEPNEKVGLSEAQSRVLTYALAGLTEKEIAHRLHRSHHTVNSHLRAIYRHYNVSSRAELMALAIEHDLKER